MPQEVNPPCCTRYDGLSWCGDGPSALRIDQGNVVYCPQQFRFDSPYPRHRNLTRLEQANIARQHQIDMNYWSSWLNIVRAVFVCLDTVVDNALTNGMECHHVYCGNLHSTHDDLRSANPGHDLQKRTAPSGSCMTPEPCRNFYSASLKITKRFVLWAQ